MHLLFFQVVLGFLLGWFFLGFVHLIGVAVMMGGGCLLGRFVEFRLRSISGFQVREIEAYFWCVLILCFSVEIFSFSQLYVMISEFQSPLLEEIIGVIAISTIIAAFIFLNLLLQTSPRLQLYCPQLLIRFHGI